MKKKNIKNVVLNAVIMILTLAVGLIYALNLFFEEPPDVSETARVHFIDVGQGDSILLQSEGEAILIDAGDVKTRNDIVSYIRDQGISSLKYVVGTHPHSDHIGGLESVITSFDVENLIMPNVMHTSVTYERLLETIAQENLMITAPKVSEVFYVGGMKFTTLAPNSDTYKELNNYSICLKMEYGGVSFIFTGDAEKLSEKEILKIGIDISADVLKVGHHGSATSTGEDFLNAVSPEIAVISAAKDNQYGLPNKDTISKLNDLETVVYRTDEDGTIIMETDGKQLAISFPDK